jgi:hypothetical protein
MDDTLRRMEHALLVLIAIRECLDLGAALAHDPAARRLPDLSGARHNEPWAS